MASLRSRITREKRDRKAGRGESKGAGEQKEGEGEVGAGTVKARQEE